MQRDILALKVRPGYILTPEPVLDVPAPLDELRDGSGIA
jgi:hypothetical protein